MLDRAPRRSRTPALLIIAGVLLAILTVAGVVTNQPARDSAAPAAPAADPTDPIAQARETLRIRPDDAVTWAELGVAYVNRARITADPTYYTQAQGALERSLQLQPAGNGEALIGMGTLANARHDFAAARTFGEQARALFPSTAAVYGVLADANTQLGDAAAATQAVQSMLDLQPGLPAFTRASYDLELHGRVDDARAVLEQALPDAHTPDDIAFCRYYLGELAWNSGDVSGASTQYEAGLAADPGNAALIQGRAKVAWAQGRMDDALTGYAALTARVPLPQYLLEYAELLQVAGRAGEAKDQLAVLAAQDQLYSQQGVTDDLVASQIAADNGDPAEAVRRAEAEWGRRQSLFSADALSWALHSAHRDTEALGFADRAAALGWRNATFAFHRGMILAGLGRKADARAALTTAMAINPNFSPLQAPVARATLAGLGA